MEDILAELASDQAWFQAVRKDLTIAISRIMAAFVVDEVTNIIKESIEGVIGDYEYQHSKVNQWTSDVVEQCLNQLNELENPLRYIVTCVIMQNDDGGIHTASSCFSGGSCTVRWSNETVYCIVSVFGLPI